MADEDSDQSEPRSTTYGKGAPSSDSGTPASVGQSEYDSRDRSVNQAGLSEFIGEDDEPGESELVAVDPDEAPDDADIYVEESDGLGDFEDFDPDDDGDDETELTMADGPGDIVGEDEVYVPADQLEAASDDSEDSDVDLSELGENDRVSPEITLTDIAGQDAPEDMSVDEFVDALESYAESRGLDPNAGGPSVSNMVNPNIARDGESRFEMRDDGRMGSWEEFDISETDEGRRQGGARGVEEREFRGTTVYVNEDVSEGSKGQVVRERAGYAALEEMGVEVPRHEFGGDEGSYWTAKEEFDGHLLKSAPSDAKRNVDREAARDMLAVNIAMGNWDAHSGNVMVNDEGDVRVIDLDRMGDDMDIKGGGWEDRRGYREGMQKASRSMKELDDSGASRNELRLEIHDRAREISREMVESGELRDVTSAMAQIDEKTAKNVAKNVVTLAAETDNSPRDQWEM